MKSVYLIVLIMCLGLVACNGGGGSASSSTNGEQENFELTGTVEQ